ncbi:MAG TPA: nodulation protein NfeD [Chloroflexia bacterium]|nr:nodulation protein NfeD [Chloroflexia bacterium]
MRLLRLLALSCLFVGYVLLMAAGPLRAWAAADGAPAGALAPSPRVAAGAPVVRVLTFDADVNPVTAAYVKRGIALAEQDGDAMLVILLNTPGGQLDSMEQITQGIVNSQVPVMVYVWPSAGWAASAGVFITYAAHVAVMAPGSSIGAAHPVFAGGTSPPDPSQTPGTASSDQEEMRKVTNFSVAHLRNLAELRGRNADWAEKAIRESVSVTAQQAVDQHIVDYIAPTLADAIAQADGRVVTVNSAKVTLHTRGATTVDTPMNNIEAFLQLLTNSSLAYTLITIGGLALTAEVFNPGLVFPGVLGVIMLLLGLVALGMLPVNLTGLALIGFAFILFIADLFMTSHGILTAGGVAGLILGGLLLIDTSAAPGVAPVSIWSIAGLAGSIGAVFFFGLYKVFQARRRKPTTGVEGLVGSTVVVRTALAPEGMVFADGALWRAVSSAGPVAAGQPVVITAVDGLTLQVRPVDAAARPDSPSTAPLAGT